MEALEGCRVRFFVNAIAVSHEDSDDEEILYTDSSDGVMSIWPMEITRLMKYEQKKNSLISL
ncbi:MULTISPECIES: hypothetical protein [Eisenbergiella]|uniref:Uncharacterized protein n=1 Tax=Eisenbergiella porci TaxID=2652274 RepID=A0A6N7W027_9FIRM|nr:MULTISPECIES: hypothetical protein [Eisenbergiella]MCI6708614.1 hypothetical protein [Eisenbergiella massiliensis]MDY2653137.1 hypothetical protein [Eisenbergiella porci]MDY5526539.1 hypothetical protein [Eisenbergiella porci]MSS88609.1 hypothetical protein [Eisenbergiella porci]